MEQKANPQTKQHLIRILVVLLVVSGLGAGGYWFLTRNEIYIEKAELDAPHIDLSPLGGGTLNEVYVKPGDFVQAEAPVARVGNELIKAEEAGLIISTKDDLGKTVNHGEAVASMIIPGELRVVGHLDENKGLDQVRVGQTAVFTVDTFGSRQFSGVVDEISPTSDDSSVVFSISDKRPTKQFDVKVRFNPTTFPELKDGMSAKLWIYKN